MKAALVAAPVKIGTMLRWASFHEPLFVRLELAIGEVKSC